MVSVYLSIVQMDGTPSGSPPNSIHAHRGGTRGRVCPVHVPAERGVQAVIQASMRERRERKLVHCGLLQPGENLLVHCAAHTVAV